MQTDIVIRTSRIFGDPKLFVFLLYVAFEVPTKFGPNSKAWAR